MQRASHGLQLKSGCHTVYDLVPAAKRKAAGKSGEDRCQQILRQFAEAREAAGPAADMAAQQNHRAIDDKADAIEHGGENKHLHDQRTGFRFDELRKQRQHEQCHFGIEQIEAMRSISGPGVAVRTTDAAAKSRSVEKSGISFSCEFAGIPV